MSREELSDILVGKGFLAVGDIAWAWMSGNTTIILDMDYLTVVHKVGKVTFPFNGGKGFVIDVTNGRLFIRSGSLIYSHKI